MKIKTFLAAAMLASANVAQAQVNITIDLNNKGVNVSPDLYGIFFEDINHAADGGLYAELIQNRSFEDDNNTPRCWKTLSNGAAHADMQLVDKGLLNQAQTKALLVEFANASKDQQAGIANTGYWGINAVKGRTYKLTFWAKPSKKYKGTLTASLQDENGQILGKTEMPLKLKNKWQKVTTTITATADDPKALFALTSDTDGEIMFDVVSLFPPTFKNRENGCRPELAQLLADMKPKFMRFPGGCFVEGQVSADNAFKWERTIGPIEERPGHMNANWGYRTTDGLGFHEFLQLAEDLGAKPLYVVNVGLWHGGMTPYDSIQGWIDECMQALEYANGPVTSKYGRMRALNGHPEPFNIEYLEIGNENNQTDRRQQSDHYAERYIQFYNAIKAKYPNMKCIGNVVAWGDDNPKWDNEHPVDIIDEHYYRNPSWFADAFHKYDTYARNSHKIYAGEYAVTSQFGKVGNLNAALGEAVYMMGMENNSDVVTMASYAPIFVNENNVAWQPDMIRFNSRDVMCTPSYYVQKLFPNNIGTRVIKTDADVKLPKVITENKQEPVKVGFATWATNATFKDAYVIADGKNIQLSDFSKWETIKGNWNANGNEIQQTANDQPATIVSPDFINASKYSFRAKARKNRGDEGFILVFGFKDKLTYNYFNIGGWSNTQNNIEQANDGGKMQLIPSGIPFKVENGKWYDLRVDVDGDSITCFINDKEVMAAKTKNAMMEGVYATSTLDENDNTLYVKVVNVGAASTKGTINLKNAAVENATMERLSSAKGTDENTIENPYNIVPAMGDVRADNNKLTFDVLPFSVNIIKAKLK